MKEIIVVAEHRKGELRDVTWEMLSKGRELAEGMGADLAVALLGKGVNSLAGALKAKAKGSFSSKTTAWKPSTPKPIRKPLPS